MSYEVRLREREERVNCLNGRFSYSNLVDDFASISVVVFDGKGGITEMSNIEINLPDTENGGRSEISLRLWFI